LMERCADIQRRANGLWARVPPQDTEVGPAVWTEPRKN